MPGAREGVFERGNHVVDYCARWLGPHLRVAARTTAVSAPENYSEAALPVAPRLAAVLRAFVAHANALVDAVRRRLDAER